MELMSGRHGPLRYANFSSALAALVAVLAVGRPVSADERVRSAILRAESAAAQGKKRDAIALVTAAKGAAGNDGRRARLLLGTWLIETGRRKDAEPHLLSVVEDYNNDAIADADAEGLALAARAAHLLRSPKDANTLFNKSERADKKRVETLLFHAELFVEKYDPGHAEEVLKEALAVAPKNADALVLLARVKLEQTLDFQAAARLTDEALGVNPRHKGARAVRAASALRDLDLAVADREIDLGLAVDGNDLELLSLRATARFLADDRPGFERAKREVFARNGEYARFYSIVGELAEWEHRYGDIVAMMKEATALDPNDAQAWAVLGLTATRAGDEAGGLAAMKKAWAQDHFNVRVYNTLNLYEQTIALRYETLPFGPLRVRLPKEERPVLERYVPALLERAWGSLKARYGFVPQAPVTIELYDEKQAFSVRTSGLPNIGIQGVCFGGMVASLTPRGEPFNWGNVLFHELAHVFAIQLSQSRVPRWFTEGLSEYETMVHRPEWRRDLDPQLHAALASGKLPHAAEMNRAFTHARDGGDVTVAYYASSQMVRFAVESFGMGRVVEALRLWGKSVTTDDVFRRAFGVTTGEFDDHFRTWARGRLARYDGQYRAPEQGDSVDEARAKVHASPRDAEAHATLGHALLRSGAREETEKELAEAIRLDPACATARYLLARIALAKKAYDDARTHLDALRSAGNSGYALAILDAEVARATHDRGALRARLDEAHRFDPSQAEPLKGLYELAKEEKRSSDELAILRRLAPLEQHDRRVWRLLLERLVAAKRWDEAAEVGEAALFVDVENAAVHKLYAQALAATGRQERASFELESARLCEPAATRP